MPSLEFMPLYIARVTETELGDTGRSIKAENEFIPADAGEIAPALEGLLKLPPPKKDDLVLVLQFDSSNLYRYYLPVRASFPSLSDDSSKVQIEGEGAVEVKGGGDALFEGSAIKIGEGASEPAVLGDTLKQQLSDLITQITAITVPGNLGIPSGPPINAAAISALSSLLTNILSGKVKVE